jgi:hypothetical protein
MLGEGTFQPLASGTSFTELNELFSSARGLS